MPSRIKIVTALGILVILTFVGHFFITQKVVKPEVLTIYKVTPIELRGESHGVDPRSKPPLEKQVPHFPSVSSDPFHIHKTQSSKNILHDEFEITSHFEQRQAFPKDTESAADTVLADEDVNSSEHIHRNIEMLSAQIEDEFSDLISFSQMTRAEITALPYEERERIRELSNQFMEKYMKEIRESFLLLPPDHLEGILSVLQEAYREQWGNEYADKVIAELRNQLK